MSLDIVERWVSWAGAASAGGLLVVLVVGIGRGLRRPVGRVVGRADRLLRLPAYLVIAVLFFGTCLVLWRPFPWPFSPAARIVALGLGTLLFFPGLALALWARLTLGRMYNVSSSMGAQLYADHRLVTHGPFAVVRHPMYLGILLAAAGGLFVYRTWALLFVLVSFMGLAVRARREEQALAAEFGDAWTAYCRDVPAWIPRRLRRR